MTPSPAPLNPAARAAAAAEYLGDQGAPEPSEPAVAPESDVETHAAVVDLLAVPLELLDRVVSIKLLKKAPKPALALELAAELAPLACAVLPTGWARKVRFAAWLVRLGRKVVLAGHTASAAPVIG